MSGSIPAPGYRIFEGRSQPHLVSRALDEVRALRSDGTQVKSPAIEILVTLCDSVDNRHGQYYGSWERLIVTNRWTRSTFFRWLPRLADVGLIEDLGRLSGRRTTTWQVLPNIYRLESHNEDTSPLESHSSDTSASVVSESHSPDTKSPNPETPLVSQIADSLESQSPDTNTRTPENTKTTTRLTSTMPDSEDRHELLDEVRGYIANGAITRTRVLYLANRVSEGPLDRVADLSGLTQHQLTRLAESIAGSILHDSP